MNLPIETKDMSHFRLHAMLPVIAFAVTILLFLPFASRGIDYHHDGLMFKTALDVLSGQLLFKETFSQYGALTTYLQVAALKILGPSMLSLKILNVIMYGVASAFLVAAWAEFLSWVLVVVSYVFWLLLAPFYALNWTMLPWASVIALAFQAMSLYCLLRALRRPGASKWPHVTWPFLSGMAAALVFWSRTPVGLVLLVALLIGYLVQPMRRIKSALFCGVGFAVVSIVMFIPILASGSLSDWHYQIFVWPKKWAAIMAGTPEQVLKCLFVAPITGEAIKLQAFFRWLTVAGVGFSLLALIRFARAKRIHVMGALAVAVLVLSLAAWSMISSIRVWAFLLPVTIGGFLVVSFFHARKKPGGLVDSELTWMWAVAIVCIASWSQYYPITCPRHIFWGASPMVGFFIYLFYRRVGCDHRFVATCFSFLLLPILIGRVELVWGNFKTPLQSLDRIERLRGMKVDPADARDIEEMVEAIADLERQSSPRPIVVDGPDAWAGIFASDLRNYHPFFCLWPQHERTPAEVELWFAFIRKWQPWIVVHPFHEESSSNLEQNFGYVAVRRFRGQFGKLMRPSSVKPASEAQPER